MTEYMNQPHRPTALIAEDEPLLAQALRTELANAWPELYIVATVGDGVSAVQQALALKPQVLFFDIRMPGLTGLEAAAELAELWEEKWPDTAFPALVFVTAYDQYAVQAFEAQAVDYLLKPLQTTRLQKTIEKLKLAVINNASIATNNIANITNIANIANIANFDKTLTQLRQLRHLLEASQTTPASSGTLRVIQASVGSTIHMVPIDEVLYFEAADKYIRVMAGQDTLHEYLIRTPLKDLLAQLDPQIFWQVHRGTVVRAAAIDTVHRDEASKLSLTLRGCKEKIAVSRLYSYLFKAM